MRFLIDGYNLCHGLGLLLARTNPSSKAGPHELERARLQLLGLVAGVFPGATVVFDAAGAPPGSHDEDVHQGVHIRYALRGSADDVIEDLIQHDSDPRRLAVVSDDHRLQQAARRRHCQVLGTEAFQAEMDRQRRRNHEQARPQSDKPDGVSEREAKEWLEKFGGAEDAGGEWAEWEKGRE